MPYNCVQTNSYYQIWIFTLNYIIVYKLLTLGKNTREHITVCKLYVMEILDVIQLWKQMIIITDKLKKVPVV